MMTEVPRKDLPFVLELLNFLEVFIHTVLYVRDVYPQESFYTYQIYNTKFKFNVDDRISLYIQSFLDKLEKPLLLKVVKKIYICIINDRDNSILEIFNVDIKLPEYIIIHPHEQLRLFFKSLLVNFWLKYINKDSTYKLENTKFHLCVEMKDTKVITNYKQYKEIVSALEEDYVKNLFDDKLLDVYKNFELCVQDTDFNTEITIGRNYK
jgi:hypothetical protein